MFGIIEHAQNSHDKTWLKSQLNIIEYKRTSKNDYHIVTPTLKLCFEKDFLPGYNLYLLRIRFTPDASHGCIVGCRGQISMARSANVNHYHL